MNKTKSVIPLLSALQVYFSYAILAYFIMLLSSVLEVVLYRFSHSVIDSNFSLLLYKLLLDLKLCITWTFLPALFFVPIYLVHKKAAQVLFAVLMVIFFMIHLILIFYFNTALVLLGSDLFGYSIEDISQTVGASGSLSITTFLIFLAIIITIVVGLYLVPKKIKPPKSIAIALPLLSVIFYVLGLFNDIENPRMGSDFANNMATHKSEHFYTEAKNYFKEKETGVDIYSDSYLKIPEAQQNIDLNNIEYLDEGFPFLHSRSTEDVLSPFFEPKKNAPNLVFIVVEGLGRAFTNKGAYLGSFTPFLDSISKKGLYWKNFLSNGGRTFTVLPSLLGSLPFAKNGFLEMKEKMPQQMSLLNMLQKQGYKTSFYYGGDARFDAMKGYLDKNGIDHIYDENTFPPTAKKMPAYNNFTWGYGDREIYQHYLNQQKADTLSAPQLNVVLTVSTHSPFEINESDTYEKLFEKHIESMSLTDTEKSRYDNYQKQYITLLYADDALKFFFEKYKKREDYGNTIFLITGDHRIPEIPMTTKIDRYHVPLIIYSPLLKRTANISSISSHFDVAPSILNYLSANHGFKLPEKVSFMGRGLDTVRNFRNIHQIPLMQNKTNLIDFVSGIYHLNGNNLFELDSNLGETPVINLTKKEELETAFSSFKRRNKQLQEGTPLVSDSIYKKYLTKN